MEKSFEEFIDKMKIPKSTWLLVQSRMQKWGVKNNKNKADNVTNIQ